MNIRSNFQLQEGNGRILQRIVIENLMKITISVHDKYVNIDPDMDTIENCFKKKGIPFGTDDNILGLAYQLTKLCIKNKNKESAEYFISIILGFFSNKELEEMYEVIQKM